MDASVCEAPSIHQFEPALGQLTTLEIQVMTVVGDDNSLGDDSSLCDNSRR